jgi:hypothetical protein
VFVVEETVEQATTVEFAPSANALVSRALVLVLVLLLGLEVLQLTAHQPGDVTPKSLGLLWTYQTTATAIAAYTNHFVFMQPS